MKYKNSNYCPDCKVKITKENRSGYKDITILLDANTGKTICAPRLTDGEIEGEQIESRYCQNCATKRFYDTSQELKILCPFCNAPYTAKMEMWMSEIGDCQTSDCGCSACTGENTRTRAKLIVKCENCQRNVYIKEVYRS